MFQGQKSSILYKKNKNELHYRKTQPSPLTQTRFSSILQK